MPDPAWLLLHNARAGGADVDLLRDVARRLGRAELRATETPADVDQALEHADGRTVVVGGGDGSIHLVLQRASRLGALSSLSFGLVPLGTGNDLAGHLGLRGDPAEVVEVLRGGRDRPLDLLRGDDGQIVVNAVHVGVGVRAAELSADLKDALGPLAYPLGATIAGVQADGIEVEVVVDGERVDAGVPALMVVIGNASTIGGGSPVLPAARVDDGLLDVMVAHSVRMDDRVAFAAALRQGEHVARDDVRVVRGRAVTLRGADLGHDADGELLDPDDTPTAYTVEPGAWRLRTPVTSAVPERRSHHNPSMN